MDLAQRSRNQTAENGRYADERGYPRMDADNGNGRSPAEADKP
jgi:hypothetical protein